MSGIYLFFKETVFNNRKVLCWLFIIALFFVTQPSFARKIHNRHYKFKITLPAAMQVITDTAQGEVYFDSTTNVILIISGRDSKFHAVDEYINCNWKELEVVLKNWSTDTSLQLISCNKSKKATIIHFKVGSAINGYQDNIIYFIHHRKKDVQFSFLYKNDIPNDSEKYIDDIMRTLKLK